MIKITLKNLTVFLFLTILFSACSEEGYDCDVCGDPDKAFYVNIVDTLGRPISNLNIIVKDGCGNILYVPQNPIAEAIGQYTLVDDELLDLQSVLLSCNKEISFSASNGTKTLDTTFTFRVGTDGLCYCEYPIISLAGYNPTPIIILK
ncbi:MAG: hypothetical protein EHM44_09310 [Ignavibacteriales bacterium]|nr:MAG: hypothetical protein EHM44_09310 [Ignavibacteriales bacterium]